jgi:16S rRNA C967 or C1407 C5-methylase (RsmB/RsmF family)
MLGLVQDKGRPGNNQRLDFLGSIAPHMKKAYSTRHTHPLVTVRYIVCSLDVRDVQGDHAGCVRTVHQRVNVQTRELADELLYREYQSRPTGDVVYDCKPRPRRDASKHSLEESIWSGNLKGNIDNDNMSAISPCHVIKYKPNRTVGMVGGDYLIATLEA